MWKFVISFSFLPASPTLILLESRRKRKKKKSGTTRKRKRKLLKKKKKSKIKMVLFNFWLCLTVLDYNHIWMCLVVFVHVWFCFIVVDSLIVTGMCRTVVSDSASPLFHCGWQSDSDWDVSDSRVWQCFSTVSLWLTVWLSLGCVRQSCRTVLLHCFIVADCQKKKKKESTMCIHVKKFSVLSFKKIIDNFVPPGERLMIITCKQGLWFYQINL